MRYSRYLMLRMARQCAIAASQRPFNGRQTRSYQFERYGGGKCPCARMAAFSLMTADVWRMRKQVSTACSGVGTSVSSPDLENVIDIARPSTRHLVVYHAETFQTDFWQSDWDTPLRVGHFDISICFLLARYDLQRALTSDLVSMRSRRHAERDSL
jgi:hypothetical protein